MGTWVWRLLFEEEASLLYAAIGYGTSSRIAVLDPNSGEEVASIDTNEVPDAIAVNAVTDEIYVATGDDTSLRVYDASTRDLKAELTYGEKPERIRSFAFDLSGRVYAPTNMGDILMLDPANHSIVGRIEIAASLGSSLFDPSSGRLYVVGRNEVHVVDTTTDALVKTIGLTAAPYAAFTLAIMPAHDRLYVTESARGIGVIDTSTDTFVTTISTGNRTAVYIAADPVLDRLYVTLPHENQVLVLDGTGTKLGVARLGDSLTELTVDPNTHRLFTNDDELFSITVSTDDAGAPDTHLDYTMPPLMSNQQMTSIAFRSSGPEFECSLDGAPFASCTSPMSLTGLGAGIHGFSVRAVLDGVADATPARYSWTVDLQAPTTTITVPPPDPSKSDQAYLQWNATDDFAPSWRLTYECSLDDKPWRSCGNPRSQYFLNLPDGEHSVALRAIDLAGNIESEPQTARWTIDTEAPTATIDTNERDPLYTASGSGLFDRLSGSASDGATGVARVSLQWVGPAGAYQAVTEADLSCDDLRRACTWSSRGPGLPGQYVVTATAQDVAGNYQEYPNSKFVVILP